MIRKSLLALAALTLTCATQAATYNFSGSFDADPSTSVLAGSFSFDDGVVAAGGFDGDFSLTSLTFSFQGQSYTLAQATDPYVKFEGGTLTGPNAMFSTPAGHALALQSFFGSSGFTYSVSGAGPARHAEHQRRAGTRELRADAGRPGPRRLHGPPPQGLSEPAPHDSPASAGLFLVGIRRTTVARQPPR